MTLHAFNQRILAEDLVRVRRPGELERYAASQRQARIDPNPHQIDAVIFALRRLREGGCILADEVGLGKTIEAGLVIAQSRAEDLLVTWANLTPPDPDQIKRMRGLYSDVVGSLLTDQDLLELRDDIRLAWDAQDRRHRDWCLFLLRQNFQHNEVMRERFASREPANPGRLEARFAAPPALTPFEAAIVHFQTTVADRAKHCSSPVCGDPYFIAVKRWQKFCSEKCAGPAYRESKRKWWQEHGKQRAS